MEPWETYDAPRDNSVPIYKSTKEIHIDCPSI